MKKLYDSSIKQKYHRDNMRIRHANRILTLSGGDCLDIEDFIVKGIADSKTDIFVVEKDKSLVGSIQRNLDEKVKNNLIKSYEIINDYFENINFSNYQNLDICNLDFTGTLNYDIIKSISSINFAKNADLYVNFCLRSNVKNSFLSHFASILNHDYYLLATSIMNKVKTYNYECMQRTSYNNGKALYDKFDWAALVSFYLSLKEYKFSLGKPIRYRSKKMSMRFFSFKKINKITDIIYPSISSIYKGENNSSIVLNNTQKNTNNSLPDDILTKQIIYAISNGYIGQMNHLVQCLNIKKQEAYLNGKNPNNTIGAYYAMVIRLADPILKPKIKIFFQRVKDEQIPELIISSYT